MESGAQCAMIIGIYNDANAVGRQLGFSNASSAPEGTPYGLGPGYIWMENVKCQGAEASLFDCSHLLI